MGLLVIVVLLLVVMPTLLYLTGRGVTTMLGRKPEWIGFPIARENAEDKRRMEPIEKDRW